ncbi:MAG TPA: energy transducer TonB [Pyrinomonadaceae bacterium]|nr:energy transducer TonB [Pyrinomonadaceae bacterium]
MLRRTDLFILAAAFVLAFNLSVPAQKSVSSIPNSSQPSISSATGVESDRVRDGLIGPVRRVRTETAKLSNKSGRLTEGQRVLLEVAAYDIKGNKIESSYYPIAGATLTGKEVYQYDDKGNISEMTLLGTDGSLMSKETYEYEYDFVGNWTKMTTSVAVIEGGRLSFEQSEVTFRTITYYLDENLAKRIQPARPSTGSSGPVPASTADDNSKAQSPGAGVTAGGQQSADNKTENIRSLPTVAALNRSNLMLAPSNVAEAPSGTAGADKRPVVIMDAEPPSRAAPKPLLKPVSGKVLNGAATTLPKPTYPEIAKRARAAGAVVVEVIVDEKGKVIWARAVSGHVMLQDAAVQAAYLARFAPTTLSGVPVKVSGIITYNFSLAP